jgi:hypothetical protein
MASIARAPAAEPVLVGAGAALERVALWIAYKFVKGVIIGLGLGGTGLPTTIGVLATLALYTASVRLIERRSPDELGLAQLAPKLALGIAFGAMLFSLIMAALLAIGAYAITGPTAAAPWLPLADSRGGTDFPRRNLPSALEYLRNVVGARPLVRVIWSMAPGYTRCRSACGARRHVRGRNSHDSALHGDGAAVGLNRLPHGLELHQSVCVRCRGFGQRLWPEPISSPSAAGGRRLLDRRYLRPGGIGGDLGVRPIGQCRTDYTREAAKALWLTASALAIARN